MLIFTRIRTVTREKRRNIKHLFFCNGISRYFLLFKYLNELFNTHVEDIKHILNTKSHVNRNGYGREIAFYNFLLANPNPRNPRKLFSHQINSFLAYT